MVSNFSFNAIIKTISLNFDARPSQFAKEVHSNKVINFKYVLKEKQNAMLMVFFNKLIMKTQNKKNLWKGNLMGRHVK